MQIYIADDLFAEDDGGVFFVDSAVLSGSDSECEAEGAQA